MLHPPQAKMKPNLRIIVIDDNPAIHQDFFKILMAPRSKNPINSLNKELFGKEEPEEFILPEFEIDTASQGQEGVEKIANAIKNGNPYALAFVDIRMPPGWDGIETIQHIWNLDKDMQVVICTAYTDYTWEETVEKLGQTDNLLILKKPFDNVSVRQLACALTRKWQLTQESYQHIFHLEQEIEDRTHSLQKSLSIMRATLESSTDGILVIDKNNAITNYNHRLIEAFKIPKSILEKNDAAILFEYIANQSKDPGVLQETFNQLKHDITAVNIKTINLNDDRVIECYTQPHKLERIIEGRIWSFRDITKRITLEENLNYQATHDALTGLPNRVLIADNIKNAIISAKHNNDIFSLLFIDLDRFKLINDSLSHSAGDELLIIIAKRLQSVVRECDIVGRQSGDEFIIILNHLSDKLTAKKIANKILKSISKPIKIANRTINIAASIGICFYPEHGTTTHDLISNADAAMYYGKENGANQYRIYSDEMNTNSLERLEKETELRQAITNNELFLCYQPQFNMTTEQLIAVEALIRWQHPKKGLLLPIDFIPLAEESGLIIPIGEWVIRSACKQGKEWLDHGYPPIRIAVNITSEQLKQPNLVKMVSDILQETQFNPAYLEIEVTENVIVSNHDIIQIITSLKQLGVNIALDDFGTGYSSMNYLKKIPLDRLKIDRSFIENINTNNEDEVIIRAIISLAHNLNLEVLAEGVENIDQLNFLEKQNCADIQGYYFSKPLKPDELNMILEQKTPIMKIIEANEH